MIKINLLAKRKKTFSASRDLTIGIVFLMMLLVAGIFWYYQLTSKIRNTQSQISETKRQIETTQVKVKKLDKLKEEKKELEKKLGLIKDLKSRQKGPAQLLNQISLIIPDAIWLSSLVTKGNQLSLEGMSLTANNVADFMKNLEKTNALTQIELDKTEQESIADKKIQKFKVTCVVKGAAANPADSNSQDMGGHRGPPLQVK